MKLHNSLLYVFILFFSLSCNEGTPLKSDSTFDSKEEKVVLTNAKPSPLLPAWAKNANIYEVNIRQYTKEGTFNAFAKHLPRLKEMGVDILWLMPVFPVSTTKKKGEIGSYYAVSDYLKLNPKFGKVSDFKALIQQAHELGMKVILDWVPNHTGWDHHWIKDHPEWYAHDTKTDTIIHPRGEDGNPTDWYDVAELNYDNKDLRAAMSNALEYWVKEFDVDGYRMDMAMLVPYDFWDEITPKLRANKPLFLLAESEHPLHRNNDNFNMDYGWTFHHLMNYIAKGDQRADALNEYFNKDNKKYKKGFHMYFTSNHDENAWAGSVHERMGEGHQTFAVLAALLDGMPLIYSGQEAGLNRRLKFFEKDEINWNDIKYSDFYKTLLQLKKKNKALWNGNYGGDVLWIDTGVKDVFAFERTKDGDKVIVVLNFSKLTQEFQLKGEQFVGNYIDVFTNSSLNLTSELSMTLKPWGYLVLSNK